MIFYLDDIQFLLTYLEYFWGKSIISSILIASSSMFITTFEEFNCQSINMVTFGNCMQVTILSFNKIIYNFFYLL